MSRRSSSGSQPRSSSGGGGGAGGSGMVSDKSLERFTNEQVERLVNQCVHCMLVLSQKKVPIKRSEITRLVCQGNSRITKPIMKKAELKLRKVFGLQVGYSQDTTKCYLTNFRNDTIRNIDCVPEEIREEQFILFAILSAIIMTNNELANETDLISLLGYIDIKDEDQAKKYLDKFTKQEFIKFEKIDDTRMYSWNERANYEVDKIKLFQHFERIYESKVKDLPADEE